MSLLWIGIFKAKIINLKKHYKILIGKFQQFFYQKAVNMREDNQTGRDQQPKYIKIFTGEAADTSIFETRKYIISIPTMHPKNEQIKLNTTDLASFLHASNNSAKADILLCDKTARGSLSAKQSEE